MQVLLGDGRVVDCPRPITKLAPGPMPDTLAAEMIGGWGPNYDDDTGSEVRFVEMPVSMFGHSVGQKRKRIRRADTAMRELLK